MLRLYDARSGHVSEVLPARPGRLVIWVSPTADLRGLVLADLIRRLCERQRLRVFSFSDVAPADLNVRAGLSGDAGAADLDVGEISSEEPRPAHPAAGRPAPVRQLELGATARRLPTTGEVADRGIDPLALRLATLRSHYRETFDFSWEALAEAGQDLRRWRSDVARWARSPGRPMSTAYIAEAEAALCDDLNVPAALKVLRHLAADPDVPPGGKFESFVHLDLVLALDLVSDIGGQLPQ